MYKRKKKVIHPQASSTMVSGGPVLSLGHGSSTALSQASTSSHQSVNDSHPPSPLRAQDSVSPDVSAMASESTNIIIPPSFEKENINSDRVSANSPSAFKSPNRPSKKKASTAEDVLEMLTSPHSSQGSRYSSPSKRRRLELPVRTGLNYMEEILHKSGLDLGEGSDPNVLSKSCNHL